MTEQENQIFAALTEEFHLDDGKMETMLAMLGLSYGLTVDEIRSYLTGKDEFIVKKHMQMLCRILGIDDREVQKSEICFNRGNEVQNGETNLIYSNTLL